MGDRPVADGRTMTSSWLVGMWQATLTMPTKCASLSHDRIAEKCCPKFLASGISFLRRLDSDHRSPHV